MANFSATKTPVWGASPYHNDRSDLPTSEPAGRIDRLGGHLGATLELLAACGTRPGYWTCNAQPYLSACGA
jgi:hypothetical protein